VLQWEAVRVDRLEFFGGVVVGFLASGLLGYVMQHRRAAKGKIGAHKKPQKATVDTDKTPQEVVKSSRIATLHYVLWTLVLGLVLVLFAWLTVRLFL
jgi:hypothetical protein